MSLRTYEATDAIYVKQNENAFNKYIKQILNNPVKSGPT